MKNRGWRDIVAMILESSVEKNTKTRIMIEVGLSHYQLKEYLRIMQKSDLLEFSMKTKKYITTEKGIKFLKLYDQINELMENEVLPLKNNKSQFQHILR